MPTISDAAICDLDTIMTIFPFQSCPLTVSVVRGNDVKQKIFPAKMSEHSMTGLVLAQFWYFMACFLGLYMADRGPSQ